MVSAANIAHALGDAHREGRAWRCRCPLHGGRSLVIKDGLKQLLITCWAGCDRLEVLNELRRRGLLEASGQQDFRARPSHSLEESQAELRRIARALGVWGQALGKHREAWARPSRLTYGAVASDLIPGP
jgi:putative DNA primase/helicase